MSCYDKRKKRRNVDLGYACRYFGSSFSFSFSHHRLGLILELLLGYLVMGLNMKPLFGCKPNSLRFLCLYYSCYIKIQTKEQETGGKS